MSRFETEGPATAENRAALADLSGRWIDRAPDRTGLKHIVPDRDSLVSPTRGEQEGTALSGRFRCASDHPLFPFSRSGMQERRALRPGKVHGDDA